MSKKIREITDYYCDICHNGILDDIKFYRIKGDTFHFCLKCYDDWVRVCSFLNRIVGIEMKELLSIKDD